MKLSIYCVGMMNNRGKDKDIIIIDIFYNYYYSTNNEWEVV